MNEAKAVDLSRVNLMETFEDALLFYMDRFRLIVTIVAPVYLPYEVILALLRAGKLAWLKTYFRRTSVIEWTLWVPVSTCIVIAVKDVCLGHRTSCREVWRQGQWLISRVWIYYFICYLLAVPWMMLIVPGLSFFHPAMGYQPTMAQKILAVIQIALGVAGPIWLICRSFLLQPLLVLHTAKGSKPLRSAFQLTKGHTYRMILFIVSLLLTVVIMDWILRIPVWMFPSWIVLALMSTLSDTISTIPMIGATILYLKTQGYEPTCFS